MQAFILIFSVFTLLCSYYLFRVAAGTLAITKLNTVSYVFYYSIVMSTFLGSIYVALGYGLDNWILCHTSYKSRIIGWLSVCYSMISMPIGMILLNNVFRIHPKIRFEEYIKDNIELDYSQSRLRNIIIVMAMFSAAMFLYIYFNSGSWPLFSAVIEKDILGAQEGRIDVRRNFHGIIHIKNLCGLYLVPAFSYFAYVIYRQHRRLIFFILFLLIFSISVLIFTYDTQKAPIVFYLIGFFIVKVLCDGSMPKYVIVIGIVLGLSLISLMYILFSDGSRNVLDILLDPRSALYGRMFVTSYAGVPLSFEWFPNVIQTPTWQIGIPDLILKAHGLSTVESARLMMLKLNPEGNLVSSYFIAEAWANYGIIGVILSPIIVGFNVQAVHIFLLKHRKTPLIIAFYALVTTKWVVNSGVINFLFFKSIIYPFILYILVYYLIKKLRFKI